MKNLFILACIGAFGLFGVAHAETFSLETASYSIRVYTTDMGAIFTLQKKGNSDVTYYPRVTDKKYAAKINGTPSFVLDEKERDLINTDSMWVGGLTPNKTYYFYPSWFSNSTRNNVELQFKTESNASQTGSYTVKKTGSENGNIVVTYTVPANETRDFEVYAISRETVGTYKILNLDNYPATITTPVSGTKTVSISNTNSKKQYVLVLAPVSGNRAGLPIAVAFATGETPETISSQELVAEADGDVMKISGAIDTEKHPYPEDFNVKLEYSSYGQFGTTISQSPNNTLSEPAQTAFSGGSRGVNHDGTYFWELRRINPVTYWYRETFYNSDGKPIGTPVLGKFMGGKGIIPTNSSEEQKDFEKRSYRLLTPLPGLSVLLDPDLCREKQIENPGGGQICDINDFLNYAFRLLIGVAAVVLVLRIIFEGYQYAVTDVPFLKVKAKQGFWTAVLGLLLALTAYIILNTINPKLVSNSINIESVNVMLADSGDSNAPTILTPTGSLPTGVQCPKSGKSSAIETIAKSWDNKLVYYNANSDGASLSGKDPSALSDGKARLDCSGFVNTVLNCAGYKAGTDYSVDGTTDIFKGAETVTANAIVSTSQKITVAGKTNTVTIVRINDKELKPGDLVGWTEKSKVSCTSKRCNGHVLIYIGNGKFADSHRVKEGGKTVGGLGIFEITKYKEKIRFIKRLPS